MVASDKADAENDHNAHAVNRAEQSIELNFSHEDQRSIRVTQRERSESGGMTGNELLAMLRSERQEPGTTVPTNADDLTAGRTAGELAQPHVIAQSIKRRNALGLIMGCPQ